MKDNSEDSDFMATNPSSEFLELVKRSYKENPNQSDLDQLEKYMHENTNLWKHVFNLENSFQKIFITKMVRQKVWQIAIDQNISEIKNGLNYGKSSSLERLLIENIANTWLNYQWINGHLIIQYSKDTIQIATIEFWEKRLSMSQHRYLRACETLAKVRRLIDFHPLVQVNIANDNGQQVNIASDLYNPENASGNSTLKIE